MPKSNLMPREVSLTPLNARKLMKGQPTILKPASMRGTGVKIYLSPMKHKKMERAMGKDKGYCLTLSKEEMEKTTEGGALNLKKAVRAGLKAAARQVLSPLGPVSTIIPTDVVIDKMTTGKGKKRTPMKAKPVSKGLPKSLQLSGLDGMPDQKGKGVDLKKVGRQLKSGYKKIKPVVAPLLKEGVTQAIKKGLPAATVALGTALGQPELIAAAPMVSKLADKIADPTAKAIGQVTGGYGVRLQSNYSNFLNSMHPGMHPALPMKDNSLGVVEKGGSFMAVGARPSTRGGAIRGSPMSPLLPPGDFSKVRRSGKGFRSV